MKKKRTNPYKEANEAFLAEKAKEEGMVVLDNGVMYRVLEEGHGTKKPTPRSIVYAHYTGTFHAHIHTPISQDRTLNDRKTKEGCRRALLRRCRI